MTKKSEHELYIDTVSKLNLDTKEGRHNAFIKLMAFELGAAHRRDDSTVGVEAVPTDPSELCRKLIEERDWRPYCLNCSLRGRVNRHLFGFQCPQCGQKLNWKCEVID